MGSHNIELYGGPNHGEIEKINCEEVQIGDIIFRKKNLYEICLKDCAFNVGEFNEQ